MRKYEYVTINIEDLYVNPENYRYINDVDNELKAIIEMFTVNIGEPVKEMINLSRDIITEGLNPFEMPIVCYDEEIKKYIVYDGNRRISCIKLMTQYKNNEYILNKIPAVLEIYKMTCDIDAVQCVKYDNPEDAKHYLYKIHQDVNEGVGRKQWDYQAKMKAKAASGNKSKTYSIVEFIKKNKLTDASLIQKMDTNRWISKLERVVGFARFKATYNITFDDKNDLIYKDTEEQVVIMMSKLISDLIDNSATNNFRFKSDFDNYIEKLDNKYKTQFKDEKKHKNGTNTTSTEDIESNHISTNVDCSTNPKDIDSTTDGIMSDYGSYEENSGTGEPRNRSFRTALKKESLRLGKQYSEDSYDCLNEKGKQILLELESLNIKLFPFAAAALCRAEIECVTKLWIDEVANTAFNSNSLPSIFTGCINELRSKKIIDNNEHKVLSSEINSQNFITLLNTWIHSDTSACVSETNLVSGWKNTRLMIEKYIDKKRNEK